MSWFSHKWASQMQISRHDHLLVIFHVHKLILFCVDTLCIFFKKERIITLISILRYLVMSCYIYSLASQVFLPCSLCDLTCCSPASTREEALKLELLAQREGLVANPLPYLMACLACSHHQTCPKLINIELVCLLNVC